MEGSLQLMHQTNIELTALYENTLNYQQWIHVWQRFRPRLAHHTFNPRIVARWYVANLYAE